MEFAFKIDNVLHRFPTENPPAFKLGNDAVVSNEQTDITFGQPWYQNGYSCQPILNENEFWNLKNELTVCIERIIQEELKISTEHFSLEKYHDYVLSDSDHFKIISRTRDLYLTDFTVDVKGLFGKFRHILGFPLTDIDPATEQPIYVILRINRPQSGDFNPPHKDVYHFMDGEEAYVPLFLNIWIPVCGVNERSSLPIVGKSHLIPENKIERTFTGGIIGKNTYNVRMIKEWNGENSLSRSKVKYGDALFFSPHLIHGLALNEQPDTTRVSLEFRLFKKYT